MDLHNYQASVINMFFIAWREIINSVDYVQIGLGNFVKFAENVIIY